jgi:hypothetical protein
MKDFKIYLFLFRIAILWKQWCFRAKDKNLPKANEEEYA